MRFLSASFRDFRNLRELDLDLSEPGQPDTPLPVAVLVGPNGSGKTAILEGLLRLGWLLAGATAYRGTRPPGKEVRAGATESHLEAKLWLEASDQARLLEVQKESQTYRFQRDIFRDQPKAHIITKIVPSNKDAPLDFLIESPEKADPWAFMRSFSEDISPPSLLYFDATRNLARSPLRSAAPATQPYAARFATEHGATSKRYRWTKRRLVGLKFAQLLAREKGQEEPMFDRLWPAIEKILHPVRFKEITAGLEILFETRSGVVEFDDLSSGERSVIFLFADLLSRGIDSATILIDEPEMHLHPVWQDRILGALREALPRCQFIVATQSPFVAASVREAKYIFNLGLLDR